MVIAQRGLSNNGGNKFCERKVNDDMRFQTHDPETTLTSLVLKELGLLPPIPWRVKGIFKFWGFGIDCRLKVFCKRRKRRPWKSD